MHYAQWTVFSDDLVAPVIAQIVQAVHAANKAIFEAMGRYVLQVSFPQHSEVSTGRQVRVFCNDESTLVMFQQHEKIKPLRRTPGVQTGAILPVPTDSTDTVVFHRARDAEKTRRRHAASTTDEAPTRKRVAPYFEVMLRSKVELRPFPLRIRPGSSTDLRELDSYGMGGVPIPSF